MSVVPSSLDSSIRDVPPSTLAPDEKVEQPSVGTFRVTDRQRSPLLEAEQNTAPAAGRTGPLTWHASASVRVSDETLKSIAANLPAFTALCNKTLQETLDRMVETA